jgi:plasmid stabilization system protein ParE
MIFRIIVEPTAEREIRSAARWKTENSSPSVAARWYNGLIKKIDTLHRLRSRCPLAAENDKFPDRARSTIEG